MKDTANRQTSQIATLTNRMNGLQKAVRRQEFDLAPAESCQEPDQDLDRWTSVCDDFNAELEQLRSRNLSQSNEYETKLDENSVFIAQRDKNSKIRFRR
jgi:hypothetical protein